MNRYYQSRDYDLEYLQDVLEVLADDIDDGSVPVVDYTESVNVMSNDLPTVTFEIEVAPTESSDIAYLLELDRMFDIP